MSILIVQASALPTLAFGIYLLFAVVIIWVSRILKSKKTKKPIHFILPIFLSFIMGAILLTIALKVI